VTEYELLLFLHLIGVFALVSGVAASIACRAVAARVGSSEAVLALLNASSFAVRRVALTGSLLVLAAGIALGARSHGAWAFGDAWIAGAIVLWLASALLGALVHAPRAKAIRALAEPLAAAREPVTGRLRAALHGGRGARMLDLALLAGMLALMVFKPGA
jgi:hypothetical protein